MALVLFYPVENWRGRRAWEKSQKELAAKGEVLDWDAYIPPPVSDEQNVFKAPHMAEWFIGRGTNEFARRLDTKNLKEFCRRFQTNVVIEVAVVALNEKIDRQKADIVLQYDPPILTRALEDDSSAVTHQRSSRIPLIQFQDVPLQIAIESLAHQAGWNCRFDPALDFNDPESPKPNVTCHWQDVTAAQALFSLLNTYNLQLTIDPKSKVGIISRINSRRSGFVYAGSDDLLKEIKELIQKSILPATNEASDDERVKTSQGFEIALSSSRRTEPSRVVIRAEKLPSLEEITDCFPTVVVLSGGEKIGLRVDGSSNQFRLLLSPPPFIASEYLDWSDQFVPEFDIMREALTRTHARMEGDYRHPGSVPIPNYVTFRRVAETLTQRAQCYLLLKQSDKALHELTLLHKLNRLLECRPIGIAAVMTQSAISDLYVRVVSDGLRQQAWREPHLTEIRDQLNEVDLLPFLMQAFRSERASFPKTMELEVTARLKKPHAFRLYPRGWLYQNYVSSLAMYEEQMSCLDVTNRVVFPKRVEQHREKMANYRVFWPYELFAYIAMPNYTKAIESLAFQQTQRDEAQVACALELYYLAVRKYPDSLEALRPRFLERIPHDIVGGHSVKYRRQGDRGFALYSIGWDETDEHGNLQFNKDGSVEKSKGDWVWQ
jgi:hypothetical protein